MLAELADTINIKETNTQAALAKVAELETQIVDLTNSLTEKNTQLTKIQAEMDSQQKHFQDMEKQKIEYDELMRKLKQVMQEKSEPIINQNYQRLR